MGNGFLTGGVFGPVREEVTLTDLEVTGTIPEHLDGRYARIGPNPVTSADPAMHHWFMGEGMVYGVRLRDGRAEWYRNRWVRSSRVTDVLGEPRRAGPRRRGFDVAPNTNVIGRDGRTFALMEGGARPYELRDDFSTIGACDFDGTLPGGYTAHPHEDPATGDLHAVSYFYGLGNKVQYSVLGSDLRVRSVTEIEVGGSPMIHDFSLTEHYAVIYDLPVVFQPDLAVRGMPSPLRRPLSSALHRIVGRHPIPEPIANTMLAGMGRVDRYGLPYRWDPDYPARVGLVSREDPTAPVQWFEVEQCYVFHPLNAYEEGGTVVLDVVRHPSMFVGECWGPDSDSSRLDRWTLDLFSGKVREECLDDHSQEFPRLDERRAGHRHRFGYAVGVGDQLGKLIRHDLVEGRSESRSFGGGRIPSEFTFVHDDADAEEDEGTLVGYVHDLTDDTTELMFLDAGTLGTIGAVSLPVRIPLGFHGNWVPQA